MSLMAVKETAKITRETSLGTGIWLQEKLREGVMSKEDGKFLEDEGMGMSEVRIVSVCA